MNDSLALLDVVKYEYNTMAFPHLNMPSGERIGVIAQNVETVFPSLVKTIHVAPTENVVVESALQTSDFLSVSYIEFLPMLIKAYQERQAMMDAQSLQIEALESQLEQLQQALSEQ